MTEQDLEAILEEVEAHLTASLFKRLVDTIESVRASEKAKNQKQTIRTRMTQKLL